MVFGRAVQRMHDSEHQLRLMIDTIPTLAWSCRPDGTTEFLNKRWLDYTGLSPEQALGWGWKAPIHPEDTEQFMNKWRSLLASDEPGEIEARLRRLDGDYRWFLFRAVPVLDEQRNVVRWYGTNTDIEDLKRTESLLAAENRSLEMIVGGSSLTAILEDLCATIDAQSSQITSSILLMDPDGTKLWPAAGGRVPSGWAAAIRPVAIGPCVGSCGTAAFLKRRVIVTDIATDPLWAIFRDAALSNGLRAAWSQPLISKNGEVLGTFCMYYAQPRSPNHTDLQLIEAAARIAVIAIAGERAQAGLRNALGEARQIVNAMPQHVVVLAPDGNTLYVNQSVLDYTGLTMEEATGNDFRNLIFHPEDVARVVEQRQKGLQQGVPFELEQRALGKDGRHRWYLILYKPMIGEEGRIIRWYASATDIDDRKNAEERVRNENLALREEVDRTSMFEEIVGSSTALRAVLTQVAKVAPTDSTVLILGETGTGKELVARAIHKRSTRSSRAFIRVNCGAIPPALVASELFGYEKGAFTGALQRRLGRFESANGGTIFLDEIGELPAETQIALLRVLQERELERVGGSQSVPVDVRVLAASNRDLKATVAAGAFRGDLFYRLNVFPIHMPSLRDRIDDIPLLVEYLIERFAKKAGKRIRNIEKRTLDLFQAYPWPGNIRELQNVIERAVILCDGELFSVDEAWLAPESRHETTESSAPARAQLRLDMNQERKIIEAALAECRGRISGPSGAASKLGVPRQTLETKMASLGINKHRFKST